MKTLANCKPSEFLKQTNRIRKKAEKWLKDTNLIEIRNMKAVLESMPKDATGEERLAIVERNRIKTEELAREKLSLTLDAILEKYPDETLEMLALCCFIEPEEADEQEVGVYLNAVAELIGNSAVLNFFTSVVLLGQINTFQALKR